MGTSGKRRPYCELGKMLDALARERKVRGPYNIAHQVHNAAGFEVSGQAVSRYLFGEYSPQREVIKAFTDAFELPSYERAELAWSYTYGSRADVADNRRLSSSGSFVPRIFWVSGKGPAGKKTPCPTVVV
jgi:hypothetical protein